MSVPVALDELWARVAEFAGPPFLISAAGGRPHVVSVAAHIDGDRLVIGAGDTTRANATASGVATVMWSAAPGADYSLIVDGSCVVAGGSVVLSPTRAVLHRSADADQSLPSCVKIVSA